MRPIWSRRVVPIPAGMPPPRPGDPRFTPPLKQPAVKRLQAAVSLGPDGKVAYALAAAGALTLMSNTNGRPLPKRGFRLHPGARFLSPPGARELTSLDTKGGVTVWSLGKESGPSRLKYVLRFYRRLWSLGRQYDCVLVHMNPIYIILGGAIWKALGRPFYQWYNHQHGGLTAATAIRSADIAFYTSPHSFTARFRNSRPMPAGIDTRQWSLVRSATGRASAMTIFSCVSTNSTWCTVM